MHVSRYANLSLRAQHAHRNTVSAPVLCVPSQQRAGPTSSTACGVVVHAEGVRLHQGLDSATQAAQPAADTRTQHPQPLHAYKRRLSVKCIN